MSSSSLCKAVLCLLVCTLLTLTVSDVSAEAELLTYQGHLTGSDGTPVPDDIYEMFFSIYPDSVGGISLWSEVQMVLTTYGYFTVRLGSATPLDFTAINNQPLFLEVQIGGDPPIEPRTRLTSVPKATYAERLNGDISTGDHSLTMRDADGDEILSITSDEKIGGALFQLKASDDPPIPQIEMRSSEAGGSFSLTKPGGEYMGVEPSPFHDGGIFSMHYLDNSPVQTPIPMVELEFDPAVGGSFALFNNDSIICDIEPFDFGGMLRLFKSMPDVKEPVVEISSNNLGGMMAMHEFYTGADKDSAVFDYSGLAIYQGDILNALLNGDGMNLFATCAERGGALNTKITGCGFTMVDDTTGDTIMHIGDDGIIINDMTGGERGIPAASLTPYGLFLANGAADGYVLTCDATGLGNWAPPTGGGGGGWVDNGFYVNLESINDYVGIGTPNPIGKLEVDCNAQYAGYFSTEHNGASGEIHVVHAEFDGPTGISPDPIAVYGRSDPANEEGIGGYFRGGKYGIQALVNPTASGNYYGILSQVTGTGGYLSGVRSLISGGSGGHGLYGSAYACGTTQQGVYGTANGPAATNIGVYGQAFNSTAENTAMEAYAYSDDGVINYGLYSHALSQILGTCTNYGVYALVDSGEVNYAIYGELGAGTGYAGYFVGDVHSTGYVTDAGSATKIDHPLDPENKILQHATVNSPDMMNIYNGNAILDASGEAVVALPEYFEALNKDFRYQLTCVGGYAPVYIAEKIASSQFQIAGGSPGLEVSWQVTGVRKDPVAEAGRLQVEIDKAPAVAGKYLNPEVYGLDKSAAIHRVADHISPPTNVEEEDDIILSGK